MGIPKYFRHIIKNYDNLLHNLPNNSININHLYFDMNSIIHPCINNIIEQYPSLVENYNNLQENDKKFHLDKTYITDFENTFYNYFQTKLIELINLIKPTNTIYLAIDGIAPRAKIQQQRLRRYRSSKENLLRNDINIKYNKIKPYWDRNAITPGTIFMYKLCHWLKTIFCPLLKNLYNITIICDDASVLGEGEHKIFDWIRKNNNNYNDIHCIYGLDADLIMLSLCSKQNIYLYRETPQFNISSNVIDYNEYVLFDVNNFKTIIINFFKKKLEKEECDIDNINTQLILYNYVFLCFIFGNDFLPKLIGFDITDINIEYILNVYIHQFSIMKKHIIDENGYIVTYPLRQLFLTLYSNETDRIEQYFKTKINKLMNFKLDPSNDEYLDELKQLHYYPIINSNQIIYNDFKKNDMLHSWMNTYYKYYFNIININKNETLLMNICNNYIEGLQWNITYYINGCPSYKWYYKYRAAPCLRELCKYTKERIYYPTFEDGHYMALEQLALVLPIQSKILLPLSFQKEMNEVRLSKWYPKDFELDILFKIYLHECDPILMNIDDRDIINTYKDLERKRKISVFDKLRNSIGKVMIL
jgi:5'-3' exonuclease